MPRKRASAAQDYLPALTGLRFWLAVWVILHHITNKGMMLESWSNSLPAPLSKLMHSGYLAVQTFFVLSGFVLARTYAQTRWDGKSLGRFFTARFARIYPVYLASLVIVSPFMIETLLKPSWLASQRASLVSDYVLVLQGWLPSLGVGWNTPAWSLSCEFFFYLCFPLLFVALRNVRWPGVAVALPLAVALPIALDRMGASWDWQPLFHLGDFIAGIAAARIYAMLAAKRGWLRRGYWLYLPALAAGIWLITHSDLVKGTSLDVGTFLRVLNVAALIGFALSGGWLAKVLAAPASDFLGKASYSMYVLHVPILWWTGRYFVHGKMHPPILIGAGIYLLLVIGASSLVYQRLEAPASVWIRNWQKRLTII
ncbi:MAG TPA: acyltransferase [Bryobacteraceae bacterium]|nr:acyltransferase [Bryobacteraceae bacterium]